MRWSVLPSAARVAAKRAAQRAEEDGKKETEDKEWGADVLDAMVNQLGMRKEVEKAGIRDHHQEQAFAQPLANFSHANEDGNPVRMTKNAPQGFGAPSRDANYRENMGLLVGGGRKIGICAVRKWDHPKVIYSNRLLHGWCGGKFGGICKTSHRSIHIAVLGE
jgi:hypothetical protein